MSKLKTSNINIRNKKASFEYIFIDRYTAGIVLTGTEIKSIRAGKASLVDTYCIVINGEVWVKNMHIAPYEYGSYNNHNARRDRKLLLNSKEIRHIVEDLKSPGFTLVPTKLYISDKGLAKLDVHLCRGKKEYDKRATMKERDDEREMQRAFKI